MLILVAQVNPIIGDLAGNAERILKAIESGKKQGAHLVVFPEMVLTGYPPEDFILLPHFIDEVEKKLNQIVKETKGIAAIIGFPRRNPKHLEKGLFNSAALIYDGAIVDFVDKILLPTYDVFDEKRYFEPGEHVKVWNLHGCKLAVTICEDLWGHGCPTLPTHYRRDPVYELSLHHPSYAINISASPYSFGKFQRRLDVCLAAARTFQCPVLLCNQVGGNDSLIFDGNSVVVKPDGVTQCGRGFVEDEFLFETEENYAPIQVDRDQVQDLYEALVLGVRDYFRKLGFSKACLGLSGGIDSAVVACIAADALGPSHVLAVAMPSRYSSPESIRDARQLADKLGIEFREVSIEAPFESYEKILAPSFVGYAVDITEENLQARIRGMLLMAFSNKFGYLVLSTGNKSELALGYSTLYGDMCGGLAVIGDATKREVYELAHWINRSKEIIPAYTVERPPSAELRPNQKDSDTLPDYDIIDHVLQAYVEEHRSPEWIASQYDYSLPLVRDLIKKIHMNEYKRRQAPPVLRVSEKAFSVGRRFPIVQKWV